jgi:hypothetical protein
MSPNNRKVARAIPFAWLISLFSCARVQPPPKLVVASPLISPTLVHKDAEGCEGEHDTVYLPGASIDAFPNLPPRAQPNYFVLKMNDGTTVWGKPNYNSADCVDYLDCRRATLVLNPVWRECRPLGDAYEVASIDGRLVLNSDLFEVTDSATKAKTYVGFACGQGFAESDLTAIANQTEHPQCIPSVSASTSTGKTAAEAVALGATYFTYRAAYSRPVHCYADAANPISAPMNCY